MTKYLFIFSIGPVQSFISKARKTQDLYSGSKMLSDLINEAVNSLKGEVEIIFPYKELDSKPNRFTAIISTENPQKYGEEVEYIVKMKFKKFINEIFDKKFKTKQKPINFDKQCEDFLQVYWTMIPCDNSNYKELYHKAESTLGAVKNLRKFNQLSEEGRKCSICGERNSLIYNYAVSKKDHQFNKKPAFIQNDALVLKDKRISSGEGICAICFAKRFYQSEQKTFQSTASIALLNVMEKLNNSEQGLRLLKLYKGAFQDSILNDEVFYEKNLTENYFNKNELKEYINRLPKIIEIQKKIGEFIKENNIKMSSYYAVIASDGDSMGKWLSGIKLKDDSHNMKKFHIELSRRLGEFAKKAQDFLQPPYGQTVYAGGEDFLGFINLNYLFTVLKELRIYFDTIVNQPLKPFYKDTNYNITFSAGVSIAHYKTPLSVTLNWARTMEKEAKAIDDDKDAFSIAVVKHSGEIRKTRYKWKDKDTWIIDIMKRIITGLMNGEFSSNFIQVLEKEMRLLIDKNNDFSEEKIIELEIKRLVEKAYQIPREENESMEDFKERKKITISNMKEDIFNLYLNSRSVDKKSMDTFLSALSICNFIKKEVYHDN